MIKTIEWNSKKIEFEDDYVNMGFVLDLTNANSEKESLNMQFSLLKQCLKTPIDLRKLKPKEWGELFVEIMKTVGQIAK